VGAWIVLAVVIAGMVTLLVVIAIVVSHTGQTAPLGDGPSRTAARYSNTCGLRQTWAATNTRTSTRHVVARRAGGPSLSRHLPLGGRMTAEGARPQPDCRQIVVRLRYGVKGGCDRWATSSGNSAWSTYTQSRPRRLPSGGQIGSSQSDGGNGGATRTAAGYRVAVSAGAARYHSRRVMRPVKMCMTVLVVAVP
jgi:hypothetical protein